MLSRKKFLVFEILPEGCCLISIRRLVSLSKRRLYKGHAFVRINACVNISLTNNPEYYWIKLYKIECRKCKKTMLQQLDLDSFSHSVSFINEKSIYQTGCTEQNTISILLSILSEKIVQCLYTVEFPHCC